MLKKRNAYLTAVIAIIAAAAMIMAAAPAGADDTPVEAFKKLGKAAQNSDWGSFWDGCEESTQQTLGKLFLFIVAMGAIENQDLQKKLEAELGPPPEDPKKAVVTRDQFIKIMAMMKEMDTEGEDVEDFFTDSKVEEKERQEDKAVLVVEAEGKSKEEVIMLLKGGAWKFFMADPFAEGAKPPTGEATEEKTPSGTSGDDRSEKAKAFLKGFFE